MIPPTPDLSALITEHETKLRDNPWPIEDEKMTYILPLKEFQTLLALSRWAVTARDTLDELSRLGNGSRLGNSEGNVIAQKTLSSFPHIQ